MAKGSPAEAAGIKEGDEVIGINKVFTQNLDQYKVALQTPNEKVKIVLRRDQRLFDVEFKVKSILR
ncbi:MAG: PDZ domain-containing protein [Chitinophagaceae bacterium]|nr:PDZ domain-containing protein [Chitinophagaceae bacterium]